ncbi:hypothetical protein ABZW47_03490 [Streptomyces sp. NPDC004549]|uniref:hypothetical protein n=1 Tax=Streptomyces sp. NPDC004549 TaxID=3154283 RepID=UPI0033B367ED
MAAEESPLTELLSAAFEDVLALHKSGTAPGAAAVWTARRPVTAERTGDEVTPGRTPLDAFDG